MYLKLRKRPKHGPAAKSHWAIYLPDDDSYGAINMGRWVLDFDWKRRYR